MNPDISLLLELWDGMKTYIPVKDRIQAAEHLVSLTDEHLDLAELEDYLEMFDAVMKAAIKSHYGYEDDDEDSEDWD